jgi:hypothetical protein
MLLTVFLDSLGAVGEANLIIGLGKLLFMVVLPIGLMLYLVVRVWSHHIGKQFDREPNQVQAAKQVQGAAPFLWLMLRAMLASFMALAIWILIE